MDNLEESNKFNLKIISQKASLNQIDQLRERRNTHNLP